MTRRDVTIRIRRLHDPEDNSEYAGMTPAERVALVWELTREMWALTDRALPTYARSEAPVRVIRGGRARDESGNA